jgi:hypothetical protein
MRLLGRMKGFYGFTSLWGKFLSLLAGRRAPGMGVIKPELTSCNIRPILAGAALLAPLYLCLRFVETPLWEGARGFAAALPPHEAFSQIGLTLDPRAVFTAIFSPLLMPLLLGMLILSLKTGLLPAIFLRLGKTSLAGAATLLLALSFPLGEFGATTLFKEMQGFEGPLRFIGAGVFHTAFVFLCLAFALWLRSASSMKERALALGLFLAAAVLAGNVSLELFLSIAADPLIAGGTFLAGAAVAVLIYFMPSRTPIGRYLLDQVEGFEMYLRTAERSRLEFLYPSLKGRVPKESPELFERCLPYALALDAADTWARSFSSLLDSLRYSPKWYLTGKGLASPDFLDLGRRFVDGFDAMLHMAYPAYSRGESRKPGVH